MKAVAGLALVCALGQLGTVFLHSFGCSPAAAGKCNAWHARVPSLQRSAVPASIELSDEDSGDTLPEALQESVEWLRRLGARGLDGVRVGWSHAGPGARYGMFASRDFDDEDVILAVPLSACLSTHSATLPERTLDESLSVGESNLEFAKRIVDEKLQGVRSAFQPHLDLLGPSCVPSEHPLLWAGRADSREDGFVDAMQAILQELATVSPAAHAHWENAATQGLAADTLGGTEVRQTLSVVSSRTFFYEGKWYLAPVVDYMNHWSGPEHPQAPDRQPCHVDLRRDEVKIVAERPIKKGEELQFVYSKYNNMELLFYYGFVPDTNVFNNVAAYLSPAALASSLHDADIGDFSRRGAAASKELQEARMIVLQRHGWDDPSEPMYFQLPEASGVGGTLAPIFRLLALQSPQAVLDGENSLFWMETQSSPAAVSWKLEGLARTLECRWLDEVLSVYRATISRIEGTSATSSSSTGALFAKAIRSEIALLEEEREAAGKFVADARRVLELESAGQEEEAASKLKALRRDWWGELTGWRNEWTGWTGVRVPLG